ncbi:hypothetical protein TNCV_3887971 [Trichonephila clavipes]|nr:hypothetical protein TNCV_3887971 [Trichonephila clavipes]
MYRRGRTSGTQMIAKIRRVATSAPTTSLIDSTPLTSFQTSSAIKRNHKETTDRSWLESPLRRLPLTPHHRQCRLDFCRPRATWSVTDWRRVIFSDESDSVSVLMTTAHVSGGAPASGPIRHLLSSGIQQFHKV